MTLEQLVSPECGRPMPVVRLRSPITVPGSVVQQWNKTYECWGRLWLHPQTSVLCLMRTVHAKFLSDTTRCLVVTSKFVCRTTAPKIGSGPSPQCSQTIKDSLISNQSVQHVVTGITVHFITHQQAHIFFSVQYIDTRSNTQKCRNRLWIIILL